MNADYEKSKFIDQVVGKRIVMYDGKITPTEAEIIDSRNDKNTEDTTKELISILCMDTGNDNND